MTNPPMPDVFAEFEDYPWWLNEPPVDEPPHPLEFVTKVSGPILSGTMSTDPLMAKAKRVIAFVDESGDRNYGDNRQSDYFTMTAVIIAEEHEDHLRMIIAGCKAVWGITGQLHWVKHLRRKHQDRRELLVTALAAAPGVKVVHIILDKPAIRADAHMREDQASTYNWLSKLLLERIAWVARDWDGGPRLARCYFGLVGGVQPEETDAYLNHCATREEGGWRFIEWPLKFHATSSRDGLQAADQYSGILTAALNHGDDRWFEITRHQIYASRNGKIIGNGLKVHPAGSSVTKLAWCSNKR